MIETKEGCCIYCDEPTDGRAKCFGGGLPEREYAVCELCVPELEQHTKALNQRLKITRQEPGVSK